MGHGMAHGGSASPTPPGLSERRARSQNIKIAACTLPSLDTALQSTLHLALLQYLLSSLQVDLILEQPTDLPCQV